MAGSATPPAPDDDASASRSPATPRTPRIWLLLGEKRGDNGMVEMLAEGLGWPCERKHIAMIAPWGVRKPRVRPSLRRIDRERSDALEPPWPDLVIASGRRLASVALWIREQARAQGGRRPRLVFLGKPSGRASRYDLVVLSSEIQMPALANVQRIMLPLMRADAAGVAEARERFRERLGELPRPLTALLVGGPTNPYVYDAGVVERLVGLARQCLESGGTPFVTTSRRTPPQVVAELAARLPKGTELYRLGTDAGENPYLGLLALADGFIVTGDSISMQVEVIGLGRPLEILRLPTSLVGRLDRWRRRLARTLFEPPGASLGSRLRAATGRALYHLHLLRQTRDFDDLHERLFARGLAAPAGEGMRAPAAAPPDDLAQVVARVRALSERD